MTRPSITVAGLIMAAGLVPLGAATTASAAPATCQGRPATVADAPEIVGTEGPDVIVAAVATSVTTLGGDDLVCIVPGQRNSNLIRVDTGDGDDTVDTTGASRYDLVTAYLGAGSDHFVGGWSEDAVVTGTISPGTGHTDTDVDTVSTGGGGGSVMTGEPGQPNGDTVLTGASRHTVYFAGDPTPTTSITTDGGTNELSWVIGAGYHTADLAAGTIARDGAAALDITPFDPSLWISYRVGAGTALAIVGSRGDDEVAIVPPSYADGQAGPRITASLGAGDDNLSLPTPPGAGSDLDGGAGQDTISLGSSDSGIRLDLAKGTLAVTGPVKHTAAATRFEHAFVQAPRVWLGGTARKNNLRAGGEDVTILGRAGHDDLGYLVDTRWEVYRWNTKKARILGGSGRDLIRGSTGKDVLKGGKGADRIVGRSGNDLLVGGPGRDVVDGGAGRDTCRSAEKRRRCERR